MRITKIYFRKFSKVLMLSGGIMAGAAIASVMQPEPVVAEPQPAAPIVQEQTAKPDVEVKKETSKEERPETLAEKFSSFILDGVATDSQGKVIYTSITNGETRYNVDGLRAQGYIVRMVDKCQVLIMNYDRSQSARLYTSYCAPEKPPVTPPRMTSQERYQWKLEQVRAHERLSTSSR